MTASHKKYRVTPAAAGEPPHRDFPSQAAAYRYVAELRGKWSPGAASKVTVYVTEGASLKMATFEHIDFATEGRDLTHD